MKNEIGKGASSVSCLAGESSERKKSLKRPKMLGWLGVGLCGLCCALPFLGVIGGITFFTAMAVYLEMIAILALGLAGVFFAYAWYEKNQKEKRSDQSCDTSCETDCDCRTEAELEDTIKTN